MQSDLLKGRLGTVKYVYLAGNLLKQKLIQGLLSGLWHNFTHLQGEWRKEALLTMKS